MKTIRPRSDINAVVTIPGSKSVTHRALITAALAEGESRLEDFLACEDTLFTFDALREMGVTMAVEGTAAKVSGKGGAFSSSSENKEIFMGNSGTSYRLLLSIIALAKGTYTLTGTSRMHERPIGDLVNALNRLGVNAKCIEKDGFPPVRLKAAGIGGGKVAIAGDKSSQYISSLLLSGPYASKDLEIEVTGKLVSQPYVDVTCDVMEAFGVSPVRDGYRYFKVPAGHGYRSRKFRIDGDVSSASYFWAAAAVTGGTVNTKNIHPYKTRQGDIALIELLEGMGCRVEREKDQVTIHGGTLAGIEVDMGTMPDMVPTLAAIALFADGKTSIRNVGQLRHKESDRLGAVAMEWKRLGARIEELEDGLIIHGRGKLRGTEVDPHDDHRLAMSLAVIGLNIPDLSIRNETCVNKSFPGFWDLWDSL